MNKWLLARGLFWGATAVALALYCLTAPDGLPWNLSTHWACAYAAGTAGASLPHPVWGHFVRTFGGHHVALACVAAALAAGFAGSLAFRFFGWRVAVAAALAWTFSPWVWNRAVTGVWTVPTASAGLFGLWVAVCAGHRVFRRARTALKASATPELSALPASAHDERAKRDLVNRIAGWAALGAAGLFAVVSASLHDYRLGEAASAYARGVAEDAAGRIVVMNGLCDEQVAREVESKCEAEVEERTGSPTFVSGGKKTEKFHSSTSTSHFDFSLKTISLRSDDEYRARLVEKVADAFPGETNLWLAAHVGAAAFVQAAEKAHPERFYVMGGRSTTLEAWERRWAAFAPHLKSGDPFVAVARRAFAVEGNAVANALLDGKESVAAKGKGEQRNDSSSTPQSPQTSQPPQTSQTPQTSQPPQTSSRLAWQTYKRIFYEVDPGNFSALVNMSEMVRLGYAVPSDERRQLQLALDEFFKDVRKRRHAREIAYASGPIRTDPALLEKMAAEAKRRIAERVASGEEPTVSPEVLSLVEWNNEMVDAFEHGDMPRAGRLARKILANEKWRNHVPANAVMGAVASSEGDYAASEAFFSAATNTTDAIPAATLNDFADTLLHLGRAGEAESLARRAVAGSDKSYWVARLTLAEVLAAQKKATPELREMCSAAVRNAPTNVREQVRTKVDKIRREAR